MGRSRIPHHLAISVFHRKDNPNGIGNCWHCGESISESSRVSWHVDHYPVPFRDIEDQVCCGVTDDLDPTNMVASCPGCNLSHRHERKLWCDEHAQFPCKGSIFRRCKYVSTLVLCFAGGFFVGYVIDLDAY